MIFFQRFIAPVLILIIISLAAFATAAPFLVADEVEALKEIANSLGKGDWNFSVDPCSGESNWVTPNAPKGFDNYVNCSCSFLNNTQCRVISIVLKSQSLPGQLPPELVKLPFLRLVDFSRNYLNGSIPREWGSMQLTNISFDGNRISGPIPPELGNISTLLNISMEYNQLSGSIPPEMGNLSALEVLHLSSNNLTGLLPVTLAKLTNLKSFRVSDNQFDGTIPNFIQNWTNMQRMFIQGSGLTGPIPSGIASLRNLNDLRISDLNGNDSSFPFLLNASNLTRLILRSCNIIGQLPDYLGSMTKLKLLDLSFNKITGPIPDDFINLSPVDFIYLSGNLLSGPLPAWMLNEGDNIDLSYNNLTFGNTGPQSCQPRKLNLFASSSRNDTVGIVSCLRGLQCQRQSCSLNINCGGARTSVDGTNYEADIDSGGPSNFFISSTNWAFSSTGNFLDDDRPTDSYIWRSNSSVSGKNAQLYTDARLSPLSLTYYAFCLRNGNYTVKLHFAEIMFTDDKKYSSLGRRMFDIYIQGKLALKDFNIEGEAGGANKPNVQPFTAEVIDNTLDIRFSWAGKGTNGIPVKGVYGPLISAISVNHDLMSSCLERKHGLSTGAAVGIVLAVMFITSLFLVVLWWKGCLPCSKTMDHDLKGLDLHTGSFTLRQIKAATHNFDAANKIGEGGFGSVYKGHLSDGTIIAVKQLSSKSKQGNREFVNEIGMISALQHPNLVKLYGCCIEGNQLLLVYEYMENNSLFRALFGPEELQLELDWSTRYKICIGIARGLAYLHEESRLKIVHRDIKATNVLLDEDLNPKISDFGLAKLDEEENTHISTRIAGTYGYMAPEYAMRGYLTDKADVYSFGVVLLEIVSGKTNTSIKAKQDCFYLLDWAHASKEEGKLMELVDPRLGSNLNKKEVMLTFNIALACTNVSPSGRPSMTAVVSMLEGRVFDQKLFSYDSSVSGETAKQYQVPNANESMSMELPWTASSASTGDLYPITLDSDYLEKRS